MGGWCEELRINPSQLSTKLKLKLKLSLAKVGLSNTSIPRLINIIIPNLIILESIDCHLLSKLLRIIIITVLLLVETW